MTTATRIGSAIVATAVLQAVGATAAHADYQTGHHVRGTTLAQCQNTLDRTYQTYVNLGRTVTKIVPCRSAVAVDGSRVYAGAVFVRTS